MELHLQIYLPFRGKRIWKGTLDVPDDSTPGSLIRHLGLEIHPELTVLVNGRYRGDGHPLEPDDQVAILRQAEGGD